MSKSVAASIGVSRWCIGAECGVEVGFTVTSSGVCRHLSVPVTLELLERWHAHHRQRLPPLHHCLHLRVPPPSLPPRLHAPLHSFTTPPSSLDATTTHHCQATVATTTIAATTASMFNTPPPHSLPTATSVLWHAHRPPTVSASPCD
ncbi:hypothetical protein CPC08DRAFT_771014 [Agrocybe pediades]|nr:hypothetical protein CPC08DRAFT_771014 [Agrocybe pediades]